uniref:Uncharacterized protein n=1 Tax=Cacopsylla melanoneura TaxID=428564 RepID=A0A8D8QU35_9HEMI
MQLQYAPFGRVSIDVTHLLFFFLFSFFFILNFVINGGKISTVFFIFYIIRVSTRLQLIVLTESLVGISDHNLPQKPFLTTGFISFPKFLRSLPKVLEVRKPGKTGNYSQSGLLR